MPIAIVFIVATGALLIALSIMMSRKARLAFELSQAEAAAQQARVGG